MKVLLKYKGMSMGETEVHIPEKISEDDSIVIKLDNVIDVVIALTKSGVLMK